MGCFEETGAEIRTAVVGLGNMGSAHARCLFEGKIEGLRLSAVCDTDPARLDWAAHHLPGVPRFDCRRALLESDVQAVVIATPHPSHCETAIDSFEAGLHVLCEKPVGIHTAQAERMTAAARKAGSVYSVMFNQRTSPLFRKVREIVQGGELGDPIRLVWLVTNWYRTQAYYDSSGWRATWEGEGGGVLMNQAVHNLDLWQWIYGMPQSVTAFCGFGLRHDIEVEDDVTLYARYGDGRTAVLVASTGDDPGTNRLEIAGTAGKLVAENGGLTLWKAGGGGAVSVPTEPEGNGHHAILRNFSGAIRLGEPLIAPGAEGLRSVAIINAAYLSAWENRAVSLPVDGEAYQSALAGKIAASVPRQSISREMGCGPDAGGGHLDRWNIRW